MSFKNILLGTQRKNYTHDLSFDNNTTMNFGVLQPLMSQYMLPNSRIKVNTRQLVRLAPMPTPSFARMYLANFASFVKMTDVVPYHEALLAKIPFSVAGHSYLPTKMPFTTNRTLLYMLLQDAFVDYYYITEGTPSNHDYQRVTSQSVVNTIVSEFIKDYLPADLSSSSPLYPKFNWIENPRDGVSVPPSISPLSADYTLAFSPASKYLMCFKFSQAGLRLRKVLLGLGFSLSFEDLTPLSFAPILAFYKAYYDRFGLSRELPFETTNCFSLIKLIENYNFDYTLTYQKDSSAFSNFFHKELSECWFTSANSYIAAHRHDLTNNTPSRSLSTLIPQNGGLTANAIPNAEYQYTTKVPFIGRNTDAYFTQLSLDVLKRLTAFVNKDSAIGKRLSDWVRVHYGADVSNSLFEESNRINEWRTSIDIDDVFSTSDTADIGKDKKGDYLGAYAGKGSGFSQSGFSFRAPVHGFVFVMSCVVPLSNTFQGTDPTLLAVDLDTIPQPEFDALGFEATPRSVFIGDNGVFSSSQASNKPTDTFGFVPRYTGFKCKKNIVNGDMCKGYYQTDLLPYFNDRLFYNNEAKISNVSTDSSSGKVTSFHFEVSLDRVPNASTEFQKICRYAFMGDYDRLFYNDSSVFSFVESSAFPRDDNFIVQSVFDVKVSNFLKPVQNSYDTIDEDVDNNTMPVSTI
jgi:hypothetical protein